MRTGDILLWRDAKFGIHRAWRVEAILLGTENSEGLIELRPMFMHPGMDTDGKRRETVLVPEVLTRDLECFGSDGITTVTQ